VGGKTILSGSIKFANPHKLFDGRHRGPVPDILGPSIAATSRDYGA
jgi:hypothetical protein